MTITARQLGIAIALLALAALLLWNSASLVRLSATLSGVIMGVAVAYAFLGGRE